MRMPGSIQFYADLDAGAADLDVGAVDELLGTVALPDFQAAVMADIPAGAARVVVTAQAPPDLSQKNRVAELAQRVAVIEAALPEDGDQPYDRWSPEAVILVRVYEALYGARPWWAKDDTPR